MSVEKHIDDNLKESKIESRPNLEDSPQTKKIQDMNKKVKDQLNRSHSMEKLLDKNRSRDFNQFSEKLHNLSL